MNSGNTLENDKVNLRMKAGAPKEINRNKYGYRKKFMENGSKKILF